MSKLERFSKRLRAVSEEEIKSEVLRIIKRNRARVIELNQNQLLFEGKDSNGVKLQPYASEWYENYKILLNPAGVVDLRVTGKFYNNFFVKADSFPIIVDSKDSKRDDLVEKYGESIFGLDEESRKIFTDEVLTKEIIDYVRNILQL
jgi:hypothetical protein